LNLANKTLVEIFFEAHKMPTVEETIKTLVEMGFSEERAKKALNKTGWNGVEQVWLPFSRSRL
jgi:Holliday junction resolvasome RuvABC DNA-binding subunit